MTNPEVFWYVVESLKAVTPLVIGGFAYWIARRQWKTAHYKVNLDLFERRFKVYMATRRLFNAITTNVAASDEAMSNYRRDTLEAVFLFKPELVDHLKAIQKNASGLRTNLLRLEQAISLQDAKKVEPLSEREGTLINWMIDAEENIENRFQPYLGLGKVTSA